MPKFELEKKSLDILQNAVKILEQGFSELPELTYSYDKNAVKAIIAQIAERMQDNYPYFHPLYAGQMLNPPHIIARIAYMLAIWINPNNHALDGGRASSHMEKEAVAEIADMIGFSQHLGHLCSGGTMANLEALWIAGRLKPGAKIVASQQAHYTHQRLTGVLGLNFESIPCDNAGRLDINELKSKLEKEDIGTVIATIGTTATGSVDPLIEILELQKQYGFRIHADAAYGGYFKLADNLDEDTGLIYNRLNEVDSLVIDPHKHGLQPYGCGCILFKDPSVGKFYKHESPYTYFSSTELHLGEISLECSRPGASAVALWATQKLMPLVKGGEFAHGLSKCRNGALKLYNKIKADKRFTTPFEPQLDIVVWATLAEKTSESSRISRLIFEECAKKKLHLALADMPVDIFDGLNMEKDASSITCLRSVLMKPEHVDWVDTIWNIIDETADSVIK